MTKEQYDTIREWQDKVFTKATMLSCASHLQEEVDELIQDIQSGKTGLEEIADCFLLLIGVCNKRGLSYDNIVSLIDHKMQKNYTRKWGDVNEKGYVKHIKEKL